MQPSELQSLKFLGNAAGSTKGLHEESELEEALLCSRYPPKESQAPRISRGMAYQLLGDKTITLIHYMGGGSGLLSSQHQEIWQPGFHTNSIIQLEELGKSDKANVVYKREVASMDCNPEHVAVQNPRNINSSRIS